MGDGSPAEDKDTGAENRQGSQSGSPSRLPAWLSVGTILTVLPAFGYLVAFIHEAAYTSAFGMPSAWISLQLGTVLVVTGVLALIFIPAFAFANLYFQIRRPGPLHALEFRVSGAILWALVAGLLIIAVLRTWAWTIFLAFGLLQVSNFLGFPTVLSCKGSYAERVAQIPTRPGIIDRFLPQPAGGMVWFLVFAIAMLSWATGAVQASTIDSFFVKSNQPDLVLIANYGDTFIFERYNPNDRTLTGAWTIVSSATQPVQLTYKRTGPLTEARNAPL